MIRKNAFFMTGTIGMVLSAALHIFFSLGLGLESAHTIFFSLYTVFTVFLTFGFAQVLGSTRRKTARIRLK
ncbi:MAG: hypothetical protein IBJ09_02385 [Bacteroidia bacterium]|nr:hypothetical protein [Bacteroidia bacterium]